MRLQISNVQNVIIACSALHNIAIDCNDGMAMDDMQLGTWWINRINQYTSTIENRQDNATARLKLMNISHISKNNK